jgi:hypothetical protein
MKKAEILAHWSSLARQQQLVPRPVPYGHHGSTYDEDGIRITGSRAFIDAVLSRLTDLIAFENSETRLQVSYQPATDRDDRHPLGSWCCYVQVHARGTHPSPAHAHAAAGVLIATGNGETS